ncbi:MAG: hypothetical protein SNG38_00595 [Rikenellaceae bacterium]
MKNRIDKLSAAYWSATITSTEQQELRKLLSQQHPRSEEQQALKIMLDGFSDLRKEHEETQKPKNRAKIIKLATSLTAAAAIIAIGLLINLSPTSSTLNEAEILCYINGEPITDMEIAKEQLKYLSHLDKLSQTINLLESIKK